MEQQPTQGGEELEELARLFRVPTWADHDELPNDGAAWLYVVDASAWDEGRVAGAWVPADLEDHKVATIVSTVSGQILTRSELAVVDQVGLEEMADEDHFAPGEAQA